MKVTYIYHSCFVIEFDKFSLIIDYYKDVPRKEGGFWVKDYLLNKANDLYVLSTHSHADHFNPEILTWKEQKQNIHYIFSDDILTNENISNNDAYFLKKGEVFEDEFVRVQAFGSTDIGVSFLITTQGKKLFHSGDLNNWHWNEEVERDKALIYENSYLCELELVAESVEKLYLTMFPVDPRLGKDYMRGAEQFVSRIDTDYFLPMHFGDNYEKANAFGKIAEKHNCRFLEIHKKEETFII